MFLQSEVISDIKEIAKKHGLPIKLVKSIVVSQFEFLESNIREGDRDVTSSMIATRLPRLGTFYPNIRQQKMVERIKNKNKK